MKIKFISILFISLLYLACNKEYSELGENSLYYIYNDKEFDAVTCAYYNTEHLQLTQVYFNRQDTLQLSFCVQTHEGPGSEQLHFNINDYHGPDKYYFDPASGNQSFFETGQMPIPALDNRQTYLYVLEINPDKQLIKALFEGNYSQNHSKHVFKNGRMDLSFNFENNN